MNSTGYHEEIVQSYLEYILLGWALVEQCLSYTALGYPKSIVQVCIFLIYQGVKLCVKRSSTDDIESQTETSSIVSTRSWRTLVSINVGP
jgi:hypothetical protein